MRGRIAHGLTIAFLVVGLGAAQGPNNSEASSAQTRAVPAHPEIRNHNIKNHPYQVGTASWYGEYFVGKPTASGEDFDMYDMTAAHPTLPLGSYVRVTNLRNGRAVVVKSERPRPHRTRPHYRPVFRCRSGAAVRKTRLATGAPGPGQAPGRAPAGLPDRCLQPSYGGTPVNELHCWGCRPL